MVTSYSGIITNSSSVEYILANENTVESCQVFLTEMLKALGIEGTWDQYFKVWLVPQEVPYEVEEFAKKYPEILPDFSNFDEVCEKYQDYVSMEEIRNSYCILDREELSDEEDLNRPFDYKDLIEITTLITGNCHAPKFNLLITTVDNKPLPSFFLDVETASEWD